MSKVKVSQVFPGDTTATVKTVSSVPYRTEPHKVHSITTGESVTAEHTNWLSKVKVVGTLTEYVELTIYDMDGNEINNFAMDESDEITGPFSKVECNAAQAASGDIGGAAQIQLIIWEYING